jgi:hypothetical protein
VFAYLGRSVAFLGERAELDALRDEKPRLVSEIAGLNERLAALAHSVAERDGRIVALNQVAKERDELRAKEKALQADLDRTQTEFDQRRTELEAALTRERRAAAWRDSLLREELLEADRDRRRLQSALGNLNPALADLHAAQAETLPQNAQELEHLVAALYTSRSWQVTAPVRWLGNLIRGRTAPLSQFPRGERRPEELRQLIAAIYASRSWRLARPLRFISRRLGAARSRRKASRGGSKPEANDQDSGVQSTPRNEINLSGFVGDFWQKRTGAAKRFSHKIWPLVRMGRHS